MAFETDTQTLYDLNLTGKYRPGSILSLFNIVKTGGGELLLEEMFRHPLRDAIQINRRVELISSFGEMDTVFPFDTEALTVMESYLTGAGQGRLASSVGLLRKNFLQSIGIGNDYEEVEKGVAATIQVLDQLHTFLAGQERGRAGAAFAYLTETAGKLLSVRELKGLLGAYNKRSLTISSVMKCNSLFLHKRYDDIVNIVKLVYEIDVYLAVSRIAREKGFCYPKAFSAPVTSITIDGCRHPGIDQAVGNSIRFTNDDNVVFLTGANMAGKSTFMKSVGIAVYLAHMGFPVAADSMQFTVMDGVYTSINVPDNLQMGFSHYYAEVQRVKSVAARVSDGRKLLVIFDELFKGTNVKDAYDATLAITSSFSEYRNCAFIISTHIIEVAAALKECTSGLQFVYLPTIMKNGRPKYTYQLEKGVTSDRHGMLIIENEKVIELIKGTI